MRFDPEEFRPELAAHEAAIDAQAPLIVSFLGVMDSIHGQFEEDLVNAPDLRWYHFLGDDVAVVFVERDARPPWSHFAGMKKRKRLIAEFGPRGIRQQLLLRPHAGELTVVAYSRHAASVHVAGFTEAPGPDGEPALSLVRKRLLHVQPFRIRERRIAGKLLQWTSTPRHWLRAELMDLPFFPSDPDTEMDMLVELYEDELLEQLRRSRHPAGEHFGRIDSSRSGGDKVLAVPREIFIVPAMLEQLELPQERITGEIPSHWLPVVVLTDRHVGLRWIDRAPYLARTRPADLPARTKPWRRAVPVASNPA